MANDITLTSTTDSLEQVQAALGVPVTEQAATAPAPTPETPPALPGVVTATVVPPAKGAKAPAAPAAAAPAEVPPAEVPAAAPVETPVAEATEDDADDADDADGDTGTEVDPAVSQAAADLGRKGGQKRGKLAGRLHRQLEITASQRAEIEDLKRQIAARDAGGGRAASPAPAATGSSQAPPPALKAKPVIADYPTYEAWDEANTRYISEEVARVAAENAVKAERERVAREAAVQQQSTQQSAYQQQEIAARVKYEDYDDVVTNELPASDLMQDRLVRSEIGAEMAYYLGKNPDLCREIYAMGNTAEAAEALGEVRFIVKQQLKEAAAAKLKPKPVAAAPAAVAPTLASVAAPAAVPAAPRPAATAAPAPAARPAAPRPVTQAPEPISPVGTGTVATAKDPSTMTFTEFKQWRAAGGGRR